MGFFPDTLNQMGPHGYHYVNSSWEMGYTPLGAPHDHIMTVLD